MRTTVSMLLESRAGLALALLASVAVAPALAAPGEVTNVQCCAGARSYLHWTPVAPAVGSYRYVDRFSLDQGVGWTYCDNDQGDGGAGSNPGLFLNLEDEGLLTVTPNTLAARTPPGVYDREVRRRSGESVTMPDGTPSEKRET